MKNLNVENVNNVNYSAFIVNVLVFKVMKVFIFQTKDILRFQENFVFKERVMSLLKIFKENREVFKVRVFTENTSQNILLRVEVNINLLVEVLIDFIFVIVVKI